MTLSLIVVGAVTLLMASRMITAPLEKQLKERSLEITKELVAALAEDIWNMDDDAIRHHFDNYPWESLGIQSLRITTEFDDLLFKRRYCEDSDYVCSTEPVVREGKTVGYVNACLSRVHLIETRNAVTGAGLMVIIVAIVITFLVCNLIVNTIVIRPVKETVAGLRIIAGGGYEHRLPAEAAAEISIINSEINAMASEIFKRQNQLRKEIVTRETAEKDLRNLNEDLEDRIRERTDQLRRLAQMLASAQDYEQKRIAEGLHDDLAQLLAACRMKIQLASAHVPGEECAATLNEIDDLVNQAYESIRLLSFELASSTLYQWGLKDALNKLCSGMNDRYDVSFELSGAEEAGELNETISTVLFKAARELLFNVVKHSGVKEASVHLEKTENDLILTIEDKGKGFNTEAGISPGHGLGLFSIQERMQHIGGEMSIVSERGRYTRVSLSVPLADDGGKA